MRTKILEAYKKTITLTQRQRSIIIGTLLGDGHLETQDNGRTYRLKIEHSVKQKEYIEWIYNELKPLFCSVPKQKIKMRGEKQYILFSLSSHSLGSLRFYAQQFYEASEKHIPKLIHKMLDPIALAVWFMDDGSFKSNKYKTYIIHTLGYAKRDLLRVVEALNKNFNVEATLHRQYQKFRIYILSESAGEFKKVVAQHVIPTMAYKLG